MRVEQSQHLSQKEKYSQTHQAILESAAILFWQKSFEETTVDEVAQLARFTKGAVYHHFESKDELGAQVLEQTRESWICAMEEAFARTNNAISSQSAKELINRVLEQEKSLFDNDLVRGGFSLLTLADERSELKILSKRAGEFLEMRQDFYQGVFGNEDRSFGTILGNAVGGIMSRALALRDVQVYSDGIENLREISLEIVYNRGARKTLLGK